MVRHATSYQFSFFIAAFIVVMKKGSVAGIMHLSSVVVANYWCWPLLIKDSWCFPCLRSHGELSHIPNHVHAVSLHLNDRDSGLL